jgi:hypothetical protein
MFMKTVRSEIFGAQQRHEHVERHRDGGGDVEAGDEHGSDAPQEDGVEGEQGEQARANGDEDDVHRWLRCLELNQ